MGLERYFQLLSFLRICEVFLPTEHARHPEIQCDGLLLQFRLFFAFLLFLYVFYMYLFIYLSVDYLTMLSDQTLCQMLR
jgi:hypothetical protein